MVTTTPKLITTPHRQTTTEVTAEKIDPPGRPNIGHSHPIYTGPGGEHQECLCQIWDPNTFQMH